MDIKAVQAEASTKAAAWLTQNLPAEEQTPTLDQLPPAPIEPPKAEISSTAVIAKPGLTDAIRRDREARTATSTAQADAVKYKNDLEALRKENEGLRVAGAATDPFEFLRHRKLSKEQQALWGQAFLYDLKPEVAPQEFRLELYKAEQAREKAEMAAAQEKAAAEQAQQAEHNKLDSYAGELIAHVQSNTGSNPESELWFTEDGPDGQPQVNHRVYAQSLFATADNLARQANRNGQQADLSPANVARVLEAEVSKRLQRRDAKRASKAPTDQKQVLPVAPAQGGVQATTTTTSAEGLRSGAPVQPDTSDEARRARAAAVLFGTK